MRKFTLLCVFLLFGCSTTPATENAIVGANNALNSIKETLPAECKSQDVEKKFLEAEKKIEEIKVSCKADVRAVKNTNSALWSTIALLLIAIVVISRR